MNKRINVKPLTQYAFVSFLNKYQLPVLPASLLGVIRGWPFLRKRVLRNPTAISVPMLLLTHVNIINIFDEREANLQTSFFAREVYVFLHAFD